MMLKWFCSSCAWFALSAALFAANSDTIDSLVDSELDALLGGSDYLTNTGNNTSTSSKEDDKLKAIVDKEIDSMFADYLSAVEDPGAWEIESLLSFSVGYDSNPLSSTLFPEASAVLGGLAEVSAYQNDLVKRRSRYVLLSLEHFRYPGTMDQEEENLVYLSANQGKKLASGATWSLDGFAIYGDQAIDYSLNDTIPVFGRIAYEQAGASTSWKTRELGNGWFVKGTAKIERSLFRDDAISDYTKPTLNLTLLKKFSKNTKAQLEYEYSVKLDDDSLVRDALGKVATNETATEEWYTSEFEIDIDHKFGEKKRWSTELRVGYLNDSDNGGGYRDRDRYRGSVKLRYKGKKWKFYGKLDIKQYEYHNNLANSSVNDDNYWRRTKTAALEIERKIDKHLSTALEYKYNGNETNRIDSAYESHRILSRVTLSF